MSRIGRLPVIIPTGVTINVTNREVSVSGPKGILVWELPAQIELIIADQKANVTTKATEVSNLLGLARTLVNNMVKGVTEGWSKILELNGTGYRAATNGSELNLALGFSHPVVIKAPTGISFEVKENKITIKGADKAIVGEIAAKIRSLKPADPYKAKGFKYEGEKLIRKAGKAAKAGGTAGGK
jgi:large subunit ribosomal protein L6